MNSAALQTGLFTLLSSDATLTALLADDPGIYDHVPEDAVAPYVVVGDTAFADWDTDDSQGVEAETTIHVWSEYRGKIETKQIQDAIYKALHRTEQLTVSGAVVVDVYQTYADTTPDPDGYTRHGVQRILVTMEADNG